MTALETTCFKVLSAAAGALLAEIVLLSALKQPAPGDSFRGTHLASCLYRLNITSPIISGIFPAMPPNLSTGQRV
jgi:hypothetical protein